MGSSHSKPEKRISSASSRKQNKLKARFPSLKFSSLRREYNPEPSEARRHIDSNKTGYVNRRWHSVSSIDCNQGNVVPKFEG